MPDEDDQPPAPSVLNFADVRVTDVLVRQFPHGLGFYSVVQIDRATRRVRVRSQDGREFWQAAYHFDRRMTRAQAAALNLQWRVSPHQRPPQRKGKPR